MKDRNKKKADHEEIDWYEKAFGKKRNIMSLQITYTPHYEDGKKGNFDFFVKLNYKMYPEMMEEFNVADYDKYNNKFLPMNPKDLEDAI